MPRKKAMPAHSTANAKARTAKVRTKKTAKLTEFHKFPLLPAELRMTIIEVAVNEHDEERCRRVVLFDDKTRRISPTLDLAQDACPLLYVNREFRVIALKTYCKVQVLSIGPPDFEQYGPCDDWYNDDGQLQYSIDIARQIDEEARQASENGDLEGCLYVNPKKDVFIIGSVPIQIAETTPFNDMAEKLPFGEDNEGPWDQPHFYITEPLDNSICAKIYEMRELAWDPNSVCGACGGYHSPCCPPCFFAGRGGDLGLRYEPETFPNVGEYGYYVMGGELDPERFLLDVCHLGSEGFLKDRHWQRQYFDQQYLIPSLGPPQNSI